MDRSVAAAVLVEREYEVSGLMLNLGSEPAPCWERHVPTPPNGGCQRGPIPSVRLEVVVLA